MTKVTRAASIPLILSDPYFSIWSPADHLYDCDTQSWTGKEQPIRGYVTIGNETFRFMGADPSVPLIRQKSLEVTATQTRYLFENEQLLLEVTFSTNLDLQDLQKISEPVTAISIRGVTANEEKVTVSLTFSEEICRDTLEKEPLHWRKITTPTEKMVCMGKGRQTPLDSSGDLIDINWGYLYIGAAANLAINFDKKATDLMVSYPISTTQEVALEAKAISNETSRTTILVAYDDIHAINYFGTAANALWKENYSGICDLFHDYLKELPERLASCQRIDHMVAEAARKAGGDDLEFLTAFSYRQSICAHKLIRDPQGEIIFLSKECSSNGCIGTVDVSYPSAPLYLMWQPELLKGMLRPIYAFADLPVWEFEFAPHDVGRYPYATGQVYSEQLNQGLKDWSDRGQRDTVFDYYQLPAGQGVYDLEHQMPIEECGNMLILASALYLREKDEQFFQRYWETNMKWANYLTKFGQDPESQLCTDDFAGHLAHNCNLSLKAIVALGLFGKALTVYGEVEKGAALSEQAKEMACIWQQMATVPSGLYTSLTFDQRNSWSMKYNMVWDKLFGLELFDEALMQKELEKYLVEANEFGVPLDERADYGKVDWTMWVSIFAKDDVTFNKIISPVRDYLENSPSRVPFSDWYDTKTAKQMNFKNRSVVGAVFMPLLQQLLRGELARTG